MENVFNFDDIDSELLAPSFFENKHYDSIVSTFILTYRKTGEVSIEDIAEKCNCDPYTVISKLKPGEDIFHNPVLADGCYYKGWQILNDLLSFGDLQELLDACNEAMKKYPNEYYDLSYNAIKKYKLPDKTPENFVLQPNNPVLPIDILYDFCKEKVGISSKFFTINYNSYIHSYKITGKEWYSNNIKCVTTYGTKETPFLVLLEDYLNNSESLVYDTVYDSDGSTHREVNLNAKLVNKQKLQKFLDDFSDWLYTDKNRTERIMRLLSYVPNHYFAYSGSCMEFEGMNPTITLRKNQKSMIFAGVIQKSLAIIANNGAGKTYILLGIAYERKRLGISKKNLFVIPKDILKQFYEDAKKLYPNSKILFLTPVSFNPQNKKKTLEEIKDRGDQYDFIIMSASSFNNIEVSYKFRREQLEERIQKLEKEAKNNKCITRLQTLIKKEKKALSELNWKFSNKDIFFDDLGIDAIYIDEAHNYLSVSIEGSRFSRMYGMNMRGSKKNNDCLLRCQSVMKANDGEGVFLATGTPCRETICNFYNLLRFYNMSYLNLYGIETFDSWINYFAKVEESEELDVESKEYRSVQKVQSFVNTDDLSAALSYVMSFSEYKPDTLPKCDGYTEVLVPLNPHTKKYLREDIRERASNIKLKLVSPTEDNMLNITTDIRKATVDPREVMDIKGDVGVTKVDYAAKNIAELYYKYNDKKLTQAVYCDIGVPNNKNFDVYNYLKKLLIQRGIPENEIAFLQDAKTPKQKQTLFDKFNNGDVRILMTSRAKIQGANIQRKLIALHQIDITPSLYLLQQGDGRIVRDGNENKEVFNFVYVMAETGDSFLLNKVVGKEKIVYNLLKGCMEKSTIEDISNSILDLSEIMCISLGEGKIKDLTRIKNELAKTVAMQKNHYETISKLENDRYEKLKENTDYERRINVYQSNIEREKQYAKESSLISKKESEQYKKEVREKIYNGLIHNNYQNKETFVCSYRTYDIYLPAYMSLSEPYLVMKNTTKECLYLPDEEISEVGLFRRINNYIDRFPKRVAKLESKIEENKKMIEGIDLELATNKGDIFAERISLLQDEISRVKEEMEYKAEE